jgi:hypothetical protein
MTDETFTELVDLYLDKEISERDLARLTAELSANAQRRQLFVERSRLHKAMQLALDPHLRSSGGRAVSKSARLPVLRWMTGAGLAASLAFGLVFLFSPQSNDRGSAVSGSGGDQAEVLVADSSASDVLQQALSDWSSEAELRRFASRQQQGLANERASLAAQLRLMGLRPELTPRDKELHEVNLAATRPEPTRSQAQLLSELQRHSVMPDLRILRESFDESEQSDAGAHAYGGGFQSSLTSFR